MGAVHLLPGTTEASPKASGEYDSMDKAVMTLAEFEDWLALEVCRYHGTKHRGINQTPLSKWEDLESEAAYDVLMMQKRSGSVFTRAWSVRSGVMVCICSILVIGRMHSGP